MIMAGDLAMVDVGDSAWGDRNDVDGHFGIFPSHAHSLQSQSEHGGSPNDHTDLSNSIWCGLSTRNHPEEWL